MSPILVIDCAGARCAAAVFAADATLAMVEEAMDRGHAERLMPVAAAALAAAGLRPGDLAAVAVCTGPGGFTGVRIGVAAARGLALGLGRPAVGVDWFAALAEGHAGPVAVALPTPRGGLWLQRFAAGAPLAPPEELAPDAPQPERRAGELWLGAEAQAAFGLAGLARIARARLAAGATARPAPLYLRPPDATPAPASAAARRP